LDHAFYELKDVLLLFICALIEGEIPEAEKIIAKNLPVAILEEIVTKGIKKMYIREQIKNGYLEQKDNAEMKQYYLDEKFRMITNTRPYKKAKRIADARADAPNLEDGFKDNTRDVVNSLGLTDLETIDPNWVPTAAEDFFKIGHWEELNDFYTSSTSFSDSVNFKIVFNSLILWFELAKHSKQHGNRLKEVKGFAREFYNPKTKPDDEPGAVGGKKKKAKPGILATFFWLFSIKKNVEVVNSAGEHCRVQFPMRPPCFMLSNSMKNKYVSECDITDSAKKMTDLMKTFKVFSLSMETDLDFFRNNTILYHITSREAFDYFEQCIWIQGALINIMLCFDLKLEHGVLVNGGSPYTQMIDNLSYSIIAISTFVLFLWVGIRFEQCQLEKEEAFKIKYPWRDPESAFWSGQIALIDAFVKEPVVSSMVLHMVSGHMALNGNYIANTVHLFLIYNISATTRNVVRSVTAHLDQLIITLMLMMFVIFMFSIWTMKDLQDAHWGDGNINCQTLYSCFLYTTNIGMRSGGGMGDNMNIVKTSDEDFYTRFSFDIAFYLIINIIFLNIVFGIIVDTFSGMRDELDCRVSDAKDNCFVCGLTRQDFGKAGKNFDKHLTKQHDPWKYVYYLYYLKEKTEDELSGLEQAILYGFSRLKTDWLPIGSSCFIEQEEEGADELAAISEQLTGIQDQVSKMSTCCSDLDSKLDKKLKTLLNDIGFIKDAVGGGDDGQASLVDSQGPTSGKKGILKGEKEGRPPTGKAHHTQSMREGRS